MFWHRTKEAGSEDIRANPNVIYRDGGLSVIWQDEECYVPYKMIAGLALNKRVLAVYNVNPEMSLFFRGAEIPDIMARIKGILERGGA